MDIVYSISVLEHITGKESVVAELARVLRPGGLLVVTFDISLDGLGEILPLELKGLVGALEHSLSPTDGASLEPLLDEGRMRDPGNVTTAAPWRKGLLPWRHPRLSTLLAALRHRRMPRRAVRDFTFSCHVFRKGGAAEGQP